MRRFFANILYKFLIKPWLRFFIGVKFKNAEVLEVAKQYVVVANHNSHFDTVSIMAALPPYKRNKTRAVAAFDYFGKTTFTKRLMAFFFNAILIKREAVEGEPSALEILDEELKKGNSLVMFPEGTRGKPGVMKDFKHGVAVLLSNNCEVPFIPVYLDGFGRVLPKDATLIIPLNCTVRFGEPIFPRSKDVDDILEEVKEAIFSLKSKDERDFNNFQFE